jgi:hypothetical protein
MTSGAWQYSQREQHGERPQGSEDSSRDFSKGHLSTTPRCIQFFVDQRLQLRLFFLDETATTVACNSPVRHQFAESLLLRRSKERIRPQVLYYDKHPGFVFAQLQRQRVECLAYGSAHRFSFACQCAIAGLHRAELLWKDCYCCLARDSWKVSILCSLNDVQIMRVHHSAHQVMRAWELVNLES